MTRRFSRWPLAVALTIAAAPAVLAQNPPMVPDMPPPPPPPAASPMEAPAVRTAAPPGVAALVNGKKILRSQVAAEALKVAGPQIIGQMILIELVNQEAAKQNIVVTPAQMNAKLAQLRAQLAPRGGLDFLLAQRGETMATYKEQLGIELKVEALVAKTLPPTSGTLKYHARHLLIATVPLSPASAPGAKPPHTDAEALALIAKAQAELKAGASFVDVADKYTEDPSGKTNGGELGIIDATGLVNPPTPLDAAFLKAALALKPGEVTPTPVKSQFGYHLIKIDSTSAAPTPADKKLYDAAAAAARAQQIQQAIPAYVQGLRSRAKIVNYLAAPPTFAPTPPAGRGYINVAPPRPAP